MLTTYATLLTAIVLEVIGTSFLQRSQQFTQILPTVLMGLCYAASFYFLTLVLRSMPLGIAYAIWSGLAWCWFRSSGCWSLGRNWTGLPCWVWG